MAYSYVKYTGNGSTTTYSIPFTYISKDYLEVKVNNVLTTAYTLPTASSLQFTVAPPSGQIVEIRRNTPKNARLVDFQDASILTEAALDLDSDQAFHITQETYDLAVDGVGQAVVDAAASSAANATAAAASYDSFDDRYLGAKATDPTLDNDGNTLLTGAIYWNTTSSVFKAWSGSAWASFTVNSQPLDDQLTTLSGITAPQATALASITAFMGSLLNDADAATARETLGSLNSQFMHVRDEKASGTAGGSSIAGNQIRTLNTVVTNTIAGASLAANEVTLPAGTYRIFASAQAFSANRHRLRLVNVTDATVAILGASSYASQTDAGASDSAVTGRIVITATKAFNLTHFITVAQATTGLGVETSDTFAEVYASMMIWKE